MRARRSSGVFAAVVAAALLLLTAWGNAPALLIASVLALMIGWVFFRPANPRAAAWAAVLGAVVAAVLAAVAKRF
jgi:hypothetical protein